MIKILDPHRAVHISYMSYVIWQGWVCLYMSEDDQSVVKCSFLPSYDGWCNILSTHQIYFLQTHTQTVWVKHSSKYLRYISKYLKYISTVSQIYRKYISAISQIYLNYILIIFQSYLRYISIISKNISTISQIHHKHISNMSQINLNYISQGLPPPGLPSAAFLQHSMGGGAPLPQTHVPFVPLPEVNNSNTFNSLIQFIPLPIHKSNSQKCSSNYVI